MTVRQRLDAIASERVLVLDGAMGTEVQKFGLSERDYRGRRFAAHESRLTGCNDVLCLTKPEVIQTIHERYLEAGADIIETCSFSATPVALAEYALAPFAREISRAAAALAKETALRFSTDEKPRFVAGVMGPLTRSASISPDMDDPAARTIEFDEIEAAYYENACGLLDGGADILFLETIFDTLNAKAGIAALHRLFDERSIDVPVMISAAISGKAGRLLAGQTVEAFCASVQHMRRGMPSGGGLWSVGLNCSFGAAQIQAPLAALAAAAPCLVSVHPNAGLPDESGAYTETPDDMAAHTGVFLRERLANIVGGCCGSTPEHIRAIARQVSASEVKPRAVLRAAAVSLAGFETAAVSPRAEGQAPFLVIGERGNVSGSPRFLAALRDERFDDALSLLRENIREGIDAIDLSVDDALLDGVPVMTRLLNLALSDPEIARVPFVIDSSDFAVIEAALKRIQGRSIANSISLKEGEAVFLQKAKRIRELGALPMVMLFDEQGQAANRERKVEIARRAYRLLTARDFLPEEICIDPNVLTIATGVAEHDRYALDFIEACAEIREECPGVKLSAGVSNLSFSFRGRAALRNAMHAVFLHYAGAAGLSMAMVNSASVKLYSQLDENLRETITDLILCRDPCAAEKVLRLALGMQRDEMGKAAQPQNMAEEVPGTARERVIAALVSGDDSFIEENVAELLSAAGGGETPLGIVEGPLMEGMREVSERFASGTMFLPQVMRSARVMKKAVRVLEPLLEAGERSLRRQKIVLATVKGDVHDIGKNIVGAVLSCNGFDIVDLGVMVEAQVIIETAIREEAVMVGLSGLVTPSLEEMRRVAQGMAERGLDLPLLVGGAAASLAHTALKIAPLYRAPVVYVADATSAPNAARSLVSPALRSSFLTALHAGYEAARLRHTKIEEHRAILPLEKARENRPRLDWSRYTPAFSAGEELLNGYPLEKVAPYIDWESFARKFDTEQQGQTESVREARRLVEDARRLLDRIIREKRIELRGVTGFFPALAMDEDILLYDSASRAAARFCFLRNQDQKPQGKANRCLADFVLPAALAQGRFDYVGLFALSAGFGVERLRAEAGDDSYQALLAATLADSLAEAWSEETHRRIAGGRGIRPAFGYPCAPDHEDKRAVFRLLNAESRCGLSLTSSAMITPAASVCGMYIAHPASVYFSCGVPDAGQLNLWAAKKGVSLEDAKIRAGGLS